MRFMVSIAGYGVAGSEPVTLRCFYDEETDFLVVHSAIPYAEKRLEGFSMVSNQPIEERDFLFHDALLKDAIRQYFARFGMRIEVKDSVARFVPNNKIESDGVDEKGPKYRLSENISNGEVAVLAAVSFVDAQAKVIAAAAATEDFSELYRVYSL